jgi:predicted DNA-binding mobile mystery protein A
MKSTVQYVLLSDLDRKLPVLGAAQKAVAQPAGGWLRAVRQALGLAQGAVAKKAGITQQTYAQFERGEVAGTLSVGNLQRAASAMDCELCYFLIPRTGRAKSFGDLATQLDPDFAYLQASEHSMVLEDQGVGDLPPSKPHLEGPAAAGP